MALGVDEICSNCSFSEENGEDRICRRHAPMGGIWSNVKPDEWCAEHSGADDVVARQRVIVEVI